MAAGGAEHGLDFHTVALREHLSEPAALGSCRRSYGTEARIRRR